MTTDVSTRKPSQRRYLAVWLRRLATDRITRRSSAPDDAPLVVAQPVKSALRLSAVNDAAARLGLSAGMALADTRARYPAIAVADAEPEADRALLDAVADWCDRYTPLVGLEVPDGLILDITGCAHLFGSEAALGRDLLHRLAAQGFHARAAIADTVGCASAVARYAPLLPLSGGAGVRESGARFDHIEPAPYSARPREGGDPGATRSGACALGPRSPPSRGRAGEAVDHRDIFIIPSSDTRPALLPLPLAALRLDADTVDALAQVGLKRIADVIERPRAPLAARFGENFVRRIDQALGRDDEPITPRLPVPAYVVERRFAEPIALESDVLATIGTLAQELGRLLERRGEGARRLALALFRTDGKVHRLAVGAGAPLRESARIRSLFAERLAVLGDACDPGYGFDVIRLAALAAERCDPVQTGLAAPDHAAELAHLIDRLGARFGQRRITRLVPQDTHIPEFAVAAVPAAKDRGRAMENRTKQSNNPSFIFDPLSSDSLAPMRPIHLFEQPERIEATAEVPDGPPAQFTWRRVVHDVARAEGPERIAMEWWRDERGRALTRDYFRVESSSGARVWLYREGLYNETAQPNWFLHGLFA